MPAGDGDGDDGPAMISDPDAGLCQHVPRNQHRDHILQGWLLASVGLRNLRYGIKLPAVRLYGLQGRFESAQ